MLDDGRVGEVRQWRSLSNPSACRPLGPTRNRRRSAVSSPFRSTMADLRFALPLLFISAFLIFEDLITIPSCVISDGGAAGPTKLKAMIVADLLLKGSDAGYADSMFRNIFISRFFRKSYEKLEPDMLVILGDIAAKRSEIGKSDWSVVLQQLYRVIGPFDGVPLVVGLGERDVGECSELDEEFVAKIANKLPGLDRTGSASFRFENVSFFLINDVALVCNENALRFGVEKMIESESFDLRAQLKDSVLEAAVSDEMKLHSDGFPSLKSHLPSGSGPVLLLHFPLSRAAENNYERSNIIGENLQRCERKGTSRADSDNVEAVPSQLMQTLPSNETEYILQSLRPSHLVFGPHALTVKGGALENRIYTLLSLLGVQDLDHISSGLYSALTDSISTSTITVMEHVK